MDRRLRHYVPTDAFTAYLAKSPRTRAVFERWCDLDDEWKGQTAWSLVSHLAPDGDVFSDAELTAHLKTIETEIHGRRNRVRHSMNMALVGIGLRNEALKRAAIAAARRIGKVEVDHGQTGCVTLDAEPYFERAWARKAAKQNKTAKKQATKAK